MYTTSTLPNGVTVVAELIPFVRSISFGVWVRNGSRNENGANNGISHFIEHMLFKGTERRSAKEIADEFDSIGGQLNAYTSKELTCYYARVLDSHFERALDVLSDMFFNSKFDGEEIEKERNVIVEEINMSEDTYEDLVVEILQGGAFGGDALELPIIGTKETVNSFTDADFKNYFKNNYRPENTLIAVAGNYDADGLSSTLEKYFSNFAIGTPYSRPEHRAAYSPCFVKKEKDIEQLHICVGFPGLSLTSDDTYVMAAFNTLFGGGMSSRLFQNIREKHGLVYSVYSYNAGFADTGLFTVYAALSPERAGKAVSLIMEEIRNLYTDRITAETLDRAKEQLKSNLLLSLENSSARMTSLGKSKLLLDRIIEPDEIIAKIDAIDADRIYGMIEGVFDLDKVSVSAVGKVGKTDLRGLVRNG